MTRPKPVHGEYIPLSWGYDNPDYEVVRGHVTDAEFNEAVIGYHGGAEYTPERDGAPIWMWARWGYNGGDEWGNPKRAIYLSTRRPKSGSFPVTVCYLRGLR